MKILVDTNVIAEAMLVRSKSIESQAALDLIAERHYSACITVQSFCTLIYILERGLKETHIYNPKRVEILRHSMATILNNFSIVDMSEPTLRQSISDTNFNDLEDACQYWAAKNAKCDILLTFNTSDFKNSDGTVAVISPFEFTKTYK